MREFEQTMMIAFAILCGVIIITLMGRVYVFFKTRDKRIVVFREHIPVLFRIIRVFLLISLPVFFFGFVMYVFVFQRGMLFVPTWLKALFVFLFLAWIVWEIFMAWGVKPGKFIWKGIANFVLAVIMILIGGYIGIYQYSLANQFPSAEEGIIIHLPFDGVWVATGAGATGLTNHHDRIPSQKYAIDFARIGDNGKLFFGVGTSSQDSHTWGAEVLSPVSGTVVFAIDSLEDDNSKQYLAGNHVIIQKSDTVFVALAHLMQYSLYVQTGDFLNPGDPIALVGNSGNSDFPHLHIHVQTTPEYDLQTSQTLPFRFNEFKRIRFFLWKKKVDDYILGNDQVSTLE
jgi:hypothetical protein